MILWIILFVQIGIIILHITILGLIEIKWKRSSRFGNRPDSLSEI